MKLLLALRLVLWSCDVTAIQHFVTNKNQHAELKTLTYAQKVFQEKSIKVHCREESISTDMTSVIECQSTFEVSCGEDCHKNSKLNCLFIYSAPFNQGHELLNEKCHSNVHQHTFNSTSSY